jgi:hypothetical protein
MRVNVPAAPYAKRLRATSRATPRMAGSGVVGVIPVGPPQLERISSTARWLIFGPMARSRAGECQ